MGFFCSSDPWQLELLVCRDQCLSEMTLAVWERHPFKSICHRSNICIWK